MLDTTSVDDNLMAIREKIARAALASGRCASDITLIGASKGQSNDTIAAYLNGGLNDLGENYLQEAQAKQQALPDNKATWHYIGAIQSNKTKPIANQFDWVHTVDRLKIMRRLSAQRAAEHPLNILLQVNLDQEAQKAGVLESALPSLLETLTELPKITCRGFMLIPKPRADDGEQRAVFAQARRLLEEHNTRFGLQMDSLSMGMSNDFEIAILEGSTHVRIGTSLFGARA